MGSLETVVLISDVGLIETIYISYLNGAEEMIITLHKN